MKMNFSILLLGLVLAACTSRIDTDVKSAYESKPQIPLNAASVLTKYDFNPTVKTPRTDHLFSRSLTQGVERWVSARLRPAGQFGIAQVTVRDATILELPDYQAPEKFEARLDVIISLVDPRGVIITQAEAKVKRAKTAPRNISEEERRDLTKVIITEVINDLDKQMEEAILKMTSGVPIYPR
ncbi:MAG: hypothetical protein K2Q34_01255 [Alphaproteobacteria bacterium]|nr:hypothetical protein [Alphaproteobacteria bacterium]